MKGDGTEEEAGSADAGGSGPAAAAGGNGASEAGGTARRDEIVHPAFTLSRTELAEIVRDVTPAVRRSIEERPQYFLELAGQTLRLPDYALVLVDKQHALPADYEPQTLVSLDRYSAGLSLNKAGMLLRSETLPWLTAMSRAAELEGVTLTVSSAYRSYDYQEGLFDYWAGELGEEEATRVSARPGQSQHQLGTAVDFGSIGPEFTDTDASRWLSENAWRWGFSLSYPEGYERETGYSYESWHYRYITPVGTRIEREFFSGLQQDMLEFFHEHGDRLRSALR